MLTDNGLLNDTMIVVGAMVVFVSFIMLNAVELYERPVEAAEIRKREEAEIRKRKEDEDLHRSQSNRMLEASFGDISSNSVRVN